MLKRRGGGIGRHAGLKSPFPIESGVRVRPSPAALMDKRNHNSLEYFLQGDNPHILLLSGMHGDEYESGLLLREYLTAQGNRFPPFLYIPSVSPTAVALGTRTNSFGNDINREFLETTKDPEAHTIMKLLRSYTFKFVIDLHEDPDRNKTFYLYDSGRMTETELATYRDKIHHTGARLYTGTDDTQDEHLRCHIEKGYYSFQPEHSPTDSGFSSLWMIREGIVMRAFTLEIPGKASRAIKQTLIDTIIPFLSYSFGVK